MKEINLELLLFITLCFAAARLIYSAHSARGAVCLSLWLHFPCFALSSPPAACLITGREDRKKERVRVLGREREGERANSCQALQTHLFCRQKHFCLDFTETCQRSAGAELAGNLWLLPAACRTALNTTPVTLSCVLCVCLCARAGLCVSVSMFVRQQVVLSFSWTPLPLTFCERNRIQFNL